MERQIQDVQAETAADDAELRHTLAKLSQYPDAFDV